MAASWDSSPPSYGDDDDDTLLHPEEKRPRSNRPYSTKSSPRRQPSQYQSLSDGEDTLRGRLHVPTLFSVPITSYLSAISLASAALELTLLSYLLSTYLSLPRDTNGHLPRISDVYSTWPFISCVGSLRIHVYMALSLLVISVGFTSTTFSFYLTRNNPTGLRTRWAGYAAQFILSLFGICLVIAAQNVDSHLHLFVTSWKSLAAFAARCSTIWVDKLELKKHPVLARYWVHRVSRWWKRIDAGFAFPLAILLNIPIYTCMDPHAIQTKGNRCYTLTALGAPADWLYALSTVVWTLCIVFDIWTAPWVSRVVAEAELEMQLDRRRSIDEDHAEGGEDDDGEKLLGKRRVSFVREDRRPSVGARGKVRLQLFRDKEDKEDPQERDGRRGIAEPRAVRVRDEI